MNYFIINIKFDKDKISVFTAFKNQKELLDALQNKKCFYIMNPYTNYEKVIDFNYCGFNSGCFVFWNDFWFYRAFRSVGEL